MKNFNYAIGEPVQRKLPIFAYFSIAALVFLAAWSISIVFGFRPGINLADQIVELIVAGLK